jgi:fibronectin-binding autotransporter adhesin
MAQNSYWVPNVSGIWNSTANWSPNSNGGTPGTVPSLTQAAIFSVAGNTGNLSVWLEGDRAASGITLRSGSGSINLQEGQFNTTPRNLTLGSGGITVEAGAGALTATRLITTGFSVPGTINTLLVGSQTWTNNSVSAINWSSRLVGHQSTTLTKAGTGVLILDGANNAISGTINGATVTGLRGKIVVQAGTLQVADNNALGIRDTQTTATSSVGLLASLVSDTQVQSGASLNLAGSSTTNEFVSFQGSGVGGIGAIYNSVGNTSSAASGLTQAKMVNNATVGGTTRFAFGPTAVSNIAPARFFQDGFTLTKTGSGVVAFVNNEVIGSGNIDIRQGTLSIEGSTNLQDPSGTSASAGTGTINLIGGTLNFNQITGSITRPINRTGGTISHNANDASSTVASPITSTGALTISVSDDNNSGNQRGTLNLTGGFTTTSNITKTNTGILNLQLNSGTFTGTQINVNGGQFNLHTGVSPIVANITLANGSAAAGILRPAIGGEGATSGTLTFGTVASQANILVFDGSTTGPNQRLRVGSVVAPGGANSVEARLAGPIAPGTGIVVLETTVNPHGLTNQIFFNGRGTLDTVTNSNQVLLNYSGTSNLTWRGQDTTNPTFFDLKTSTNWDNGGSPDMFFDGDSVTFEDGLTPGTSTVVPRGVNNVGNVSFNNNTTNFLIDSVGTGNAIVASTGTFTKSGTGTTTLRNSVAGTSSAYGATTVNEGMLELVYNNPGLASSAAAVVTTLGALNSGVTINSGGTLRNAINVESSGFGGSPVTINAGGFLDLTRGSVPNGATTTPTAVTLNNNFSGSGDIALRGVNDSVPTSPNSFFVNGFGNYVLNGASPTFTGKIVLDNARLASDNLNGTNNIDELGSATIEVPSGSQILLTGVGATNPVNGSTGYFDNNVFRIAGTGWQYEGSPASQAGALRFGLNNARIASNSSIVMTGDARITNQNSNNRIDAPISEEGGPRVLTFGNPGATQNSNLILAGTSSYTGGTNIENMNMQISASQAFGSGPLNLNGYTGARTTTISLGAGKSLNNPINLSSFAGQGLSRGAIEGGTTLQVADLGGAGVGTVSGPISIATTENQVSSWAHFSAGQAANSALAVTGTITVPAPTTIVQARSQNSGGYVEFSGGGNYSRFEVALGTVRLGANNGLASGTELITRRVADAAATGGGTARGVFDMNGFNQAVSFVSRSGTLTTANFSLLNTGAGASTLTINGTGASDIQDIPLSINPVNIVKNGTASLLLSGTTAGLTGNGTYQINDGTFSIAAGATAGGSVDLRGTGRWSGDAISSGITGLLTVGNGGGILDPGASPGTLSAGSGALVTNGGQFDWEIDLASGVAGINYDVISIAGNLDLTTLTNFQINGAGLDGMGGIGAIVDFIPTQDYQWTLFAVAGTTSGFDAGDFVFNDTNFVSNNPTDGLRTFTVGLGTNGNDVVLNYNAVPEPSSIILLVTGLGVSLMSRRRTKSNLS